MQIHNIKQVEVKNHECTRWSRLTASAADISITVDHRRVAEGESGMAPP